MHNSLKPRTNILLIILWFVLLLLAIYFTKYHPILPVCYAFIAGVIAGLFQSRAIHACINQFKEAETSLNVRNVLASTIDGKISIAIIWLVAAVALIWSVAESPSNFIALWLSAYASFAFAREITAMPTILRLNREQ